MSSRVPSSTYRLQLGQELTFDQATAQLPYLKQLGVGWLYLSPVLQATPDSSHGYDVVDHDQIDDTRGGRAGFDRLCRAAQAAGLGVVVDIVPNHVGIGEPRPGQWWWDVLQHGPSSRHAAAFDIDVAAGPLLLPVLGDGPVEPERVTLDGEGDDALLAYHDLRFPLAPGTSGGTAWEVMHRQHYRLVSWRRGDAALTYRRFFTITSLAGLRVEDPAVFDASHREIARWFTEGLVDGLRVDHPDGLADPAGYLERLDNLVGGRYVVVEKILEHGERLPADWHADGTTGYDALGEIDRVLVDPAGEQALTQLDTERRGGVALDWPAFVRAAAHDILHTSLRAEVLRLTRLISRTTDIGDLPELLGAVLVEFKVYRSYLPRHRQAWLDALARAASRRPDLVVGLDQLAEVVRTGPAEIGTRLEQLSGALTAKAVEDRSFYRWPRLTSLTEVGGDPSRFSLTVPAFHAAQQDRAAAAPASMTTLTTHDTKRSEDVRARISVLAETPQWWREQLRALEQEFPLPDPVLANLIWQAVVGAWPLTPERATDYAIKAAREAGVLTTWTDPDPTFEAGLRTALATLDQSTRLNEMAEELRLPGWSNSLAAKVLQLAGPGVPDVYQGSELSAFSLVDPDNRRPVDPAAAQTVLNRLDQGHLPDLGTEPEAVKLWVTSTILRLRRDRPDCFNGYRPLTADGPAADHLIAFDRGGVVVLATRLPVGLARRGGWPGTSLTLPHGRWTCALTGASVPLTLDLAEILAERPVAILTRDISGAQR